MPNPLLEEWCTPHGIPPFAQIRDEHYLPAFDAAFAGHRAEIDAIATCAEPADFDNTIAALERAGRLLERVSSVFFNLCDSDSSEPLRQIEAEINPRHARHMSDLYTRQDLFRRVREVNEQCSSLRPDQACLAREYHRRFLRAGAALPDTGRGTVQAIDEELAGLRTRFSQNVLRETNAFELLLQSPDDVAGLPESVLHAAAAEARDRGRQGYLFTLSRSSITPFLQFSSRRDLRERIYRAYTACGRNGDDNDNVTVLARIAGLRARRARLLGYDSHAHFMLDDRMAGTPERVTGLMDDLWQPARLRAREEARALQQRIEAEGGDFRLQPWDWWYYTEKLRTELFQLDDEVVKPYFSLENVRDGAFEVARRLYGIEFSPADLPVYHPSVQAWEVREGDGGLIGIFMVDYFMRPSKRSGAWMSRFRQQFSLDGQVLPIVINCCNFPHPDGDTPCLLGMDEVRTLFHEFGHGLHGLLSRVTYPGQSGTSVKQDFVELPSQIMEHWAVEPEVLRTYARHHETGEVIPEELIEHLLEARTFNQGFATSEYLAACYLDMAWHAAADDEARDPREVERQVLADIDMPAAIDPRYHSSYFQHIFSGDSYSAGYYVYIWAAVLDTDAYGAFRERGLFDRATADAFRRHILEKGGSEEPMELYRRFRGRDPDIAPLLEHRGLA